MNSPPLPPGSTIGILGGGQLGRMLAQAAARLGLIAHIYCPNEKAPAFEVAKSHTIAAFDDKEALREFAQSCDVVTFEFENIPLAAADRIAGLTPFSPGRKALETSQDRAIEKTFLAQLAIDVADWWPVENAVDLTKGLAQCEAPALLKTRRLGYDGKGQLALQPDADPIEAFHQLGQQPAILEKKIAFQHEISVILVRHMTGEIRCYDSPRNDHEGGILKHSTLPSGLDQKIERQARQIAAKIATALDYCGVLGVEFFVLDEQEGKLLVNEFAPRVHNTGHWTMDACLCDQFENHIRAVARWPLGATTRHSDAKMTNLLGKSVLDWQTLAAQADLALHLYGKQGVEPGRKLGHITQISSKT